MKHLLLTTIAAVVLVGCGESQQSAPAPETNSEPPTTEVSDISLIVAAEDGNIEAVKQNLAEGIDVDTRLPSTFGHIGETPLHGAATFGHKEIVELLIAKGADVNAKGGVIKGTIPLHKAASNGHKEVAEVLIAKGADVNAKSENGITPLHYAASKEIAELLLAKGANVNAKNDGDYTPLHGAAYRGHKEIAELLISKGADVNAADRDRYTPLDLAIRNDETETADLLRKHGGKTREELKAEGK
jgi:cytohesin